MKRKPYVSHEKAEIEEFRKRPGMAVEFLNAAFELAIQDNDPESALAAMALVTKAFGIAKVARSAKLKRESLHRMLSKRGNPEWKSLFRVFKALHLRPKFELVGRVSA